MDPCATFSHKKKLLGTSSGTMLKDAEGFAGKVLVKDVQQGGGGGGES